ncbi:MAG: PKD domain-containing protein, partial [Bacteroidia bacterium]
GSATNGSWTSSTNNQFLSFNANTNYIPTNTEIANGFVVLTYTTDDPFGDCSAAKDSMIVNINAPTFADAGADQILCNNATSVNLTGDFGNGATLANWSTLGSGIFKNIVGKIANYVPSSNDITNGSVKIIYTTDDPAGPCIAAVDTMTVLFNPFATISAGADQNVCANNNFLLNASTNATSGTLNWTTSGTGFFYSGNSLTSTYVPSMADNTNGSVVLTISNFDPNNTCANVSDAMILTYDQLPIVNAGADQTVCLSSNSVSVSGSVTGLVTNGSWSTLGSGTFLNASSLVTDYTFSNTDKLNGLVRLVLTSNDPAGPCNAVTDTLNISFNPLAIANAGPDQIICGNSIVNITGTVGGSATNGSWTSSTNNQFLSYDSITTYIPTISEIANGSFFITFTTDDPYGPCSAMSDSMKVTVNIPPSVNAGNDVTLCSNATSVNLTGTKAGTPTTTLWVTLNGSGTFDNPTLLSTIYRPSAADRAAKSIIISLTTNDPIGPCYAAFDDVNVFFKDSLVSFTSEIQNVYCDSMKIKFLNDTANNGYTFTWDFGDGNLSTNANPIHTYNFTGPINVKLTASGPGGCIETINNNLSINSIKPTANFSINNLNQCENSNSFVINNVSLNGVSWITNVNWDFGDNTNSSSTTPNNKIYVKAGNYNIKLVILGSNGCKDSIIKGVNVLPSPVKPIITLLPGKILSSSSNISNQWYFGNVEIPGEKSKTHVTTKDGIYNLRVDSTNGCSSFSDDFELKYTSVTENKFDDEIIIYPNPTNGLFNIESKMELYYSIFDYSGKVIVSGKKDGNIQLLDLSNFKSGIYLLKLYNDQTQFTTKIIKE